MSTDKLVLSGDYTVQTAQNGVITLDTTAGFGGLNSGSGRVIITGDLWVQGIHTSVSSQEATIKDQRIFLNSGQPGSNVVSGDGTSGILVSRGNNDDETIAAKLLWNETSIWDSTALSNVDAGPGLWTFRKGNFFTGVEVGFIKINASGAGNQSKSYIIPDNSLALSVGNEEYTSRLNDDNDIPNKAYVDGLFNQSSGNTATQARFILVGNSAVMINDQTENPSTASHITTYIDQVASLAVYGNSISMPTLDLRFTESTIESRATNANLILATNGTGVVEVNNGVAFAAPVTPTWTPPLPEIGMTKVYSTTTPGSGSTGLLFNHSDGVNVIQGELISARKALLLGIIF